MTVTERHVVLSGMSVDFFRVSLDCEAAPAIGCGCRAKPVLTALRQAAAVCDAWLSRAGTSLAVIWRSQASIEQQDALVRVVLADAGLGASRITDEGLREALLQSLDSGTGWYGAHMLDSLSEEEAQMIADRIVRRAATQAKLEGTQAHALKALIADACARVLTNDPANSAEGRAAQIVQAILEAASGRLSKAELAVLEEAVARGHRPVPGEI
jgi:hypothetical protein